MKCPLCDGELTIDAFPGCELNLECPHCHWISNGISRIILRSLDKVIANLQSIDVIPHGIYCYDEEGACPYWSIKWKKPDQANGYCAYLKKGDWMKNGTFLLWDKCKECDINEEDEDSDDKSD